MKKKIIILTDSVALPRKLNQDFVSWEDTYIFKLKQHLNDYEVINISIGGATIGDLRNQVNYYKILKPEIVILQCGIVDASPRAFGRLELEIIKKLKLFRFTKPLVFFLRRYRAHHYTNLKNYEKKLIEIKRELNTQSFYAMGIIPSNPDYEKLLSGVTKSIEEYNNILKQHTIFISLDEMPKNGVLEDHHHINEVGQEFIFNRTIEKLGACGIE